MSLGKNIAVTASVIVIGAAACFGGYKFLKSKGVTLSSGTVYVQRVQELNTVAGRTLTGSLFSGVVETQKTEDFKYDTSKKIKAVKVKVGQEVKKGDVLFTYDLEQAQLDIEDKQIEYDKAVNDLETDRIELEGLKKEKATASPDRQTQLNTTILSKQSDIARAEYDLKQMEAKIEKMKKALKNNKVKSTLDGIVKEVADINNLDESEPGAIVKISRGDDYIIKATLNEQMISQIEKDMPVIIRSRIDDRVWHGTITNIETKPQSSEGEFNIGGNGEDTMNTSSKYNFYVTPENFDGLMLGQHIIIEPDMGQMGDIQTKEGIWLYEDYFVREEGKTYVWADNGEGRIEKREVTLGTYDEEEGDVQVVRGLSKSDRIAYPSEQFEVGLKTTENAAEANVPDIGSADDEGGEQLVAEGGNDEFDADFTIDDNDAAFDDEEDGELIIEGEPDDYFDIETEEE